MNNITVRRFKEKLFRTVCFLMTCSAVIILALLLFHIFLHGWSRLNLDFFKNFPSRRPSRAGIKAAILGTVWLMGLTAIFSIPLGVASALYLEEYSKKNRINYWIDMNISNLAGVPSIVYGMLGLLFFVRVLALGSSLLSGALTLTVLILPVIITSAREAIRAVPQSLRRASLALGATHWETVWFHVLPSALPGILTGVILSLSRAIGETAPLIMVGAAMFITKIPDSPMSAYSALPMQIYDWSSRPQSDFHELAAAAIIALLGILLVMNSIAVWIRHYYQSKVKS